MTSEPGSLEHFFASASAASPCAPGPIGQPVGIPLTGRQTLCGDIGLKIDQSATWHYRGSPIARKELVRLFAAVLRRDADGRHWLMTPAEVCPVTVADAPFLAVSVTKEGSGRKQSLTFETNVGRRVTLDADHTLRLALDPETGTPLPYLNVDGGAKGGLEARIARPVFYELAELAVEGPADQAHIMGVWSAGRFFPMETPADTN